MIGNSENFRETQASRPGQQLFEALRFWPNPRLQIGDHIVDVGALRIETRSGATRLTARDMALLIELIHCRGETMSHAHLLRRVWGEGREMQDISIRVAINKLRRALCDSRKAPRYIETISCVGYRLIAPVAFLPTEDLPRSPFIPGLVPMSRLSRYAVDAGLGVGAGV